MAIFREWFYSYRWRPDFGLRPRDRIGRWIDDAQLELAPELQFRGDVAPAPADALANLQEQLRRSQLSQRDFAHWVLGSCDYTLTRYLGGARIPENRRNWLARLEHVAIHGHRLVITVHAGAIRRLPRWRRRKG